MRRPPAAKNAASTSRSGARFASEASTSKGPEVPSPMIGSSSPLEGILRRIAAASGPGGCAARVSGGGGHQRYSCGEQLTSVHGQAPGARVVGGRCSHVRGASARGAAFQISAASVSITLAPPSCDHARQRCRLRQHLRGIEAGRADLGGVELALRPGHLGGGDRGGLRQQPAARDVAAQFQVRHRDRHADIGARRQRPEQRLGGRAELAHRLERGAPRGLDRRVLAGESLELGFHVHEQRLHRRAAVAAELAADEVV